MNWKRGLFRIWIIAAVLWIGFVCYLAAPVFSKPFPFGDAYQYVLELKHDPWEVANPTYDDMYKPGKGPFPDQFSRMSDELEDQWDKYLKDDSMVLTTFPDNSRLFLDAKTFDESDRGYLKGLFWKQRWRRYAAKIQPYFLLAFIPPLSFLLGGFAAIWILRGFRRPLST